MSFGNEVMGGRLLWRAGRGELGLEQNGMSWAGGWADLACLARL